MNKVVTPTAARLAKSFAFAAKAWDVSATLDVLGHEVGDSVGLTRGGSPGEVRLVNSHASHSEVLVSHRNARLTVQGRWLPLIGSGGRGGRSLRRRPPGAGRWRGVRR